MDSGTVAALARHHKRRAAGKHQNHVAICGAHRVDQRLLPLRQLHGQAIHALGLRNLVQTHTQQYRISGFCRRNRFLNQLFLRLGVHPGEALGISCDGQSIRRQHFFQVVQSGGIDHGGTGSLIPGRLGKIADHGHLRVRFQWKNAVVLQQDDGTGGTPAGKGMMGFLIIGLGRFGYCRAGCEHNLQQLPQPLIQRLFRHPAFLNGFHQTDGAVRAGDGHYQIGAGLHARGVIVVSAPVGDHHAVKAPLIAQNLREQVVILIGIGLIDLVVAGHNGLGLALSDGNLKSSQIDFPERPLIQHGIHAHPPQFLRVCGKVLGAGGDTARLNPPDIRSRHFAGQIRVLGEILKVPAAQGAALHVQARPQYHVYVVRGSFLAQRASQLLAQFRIPGIGHGGRRGETGRWNGGVQTQMIARARLLSEAVGAIGKKNGRDSQPFYFAGCPGAPAL